MNPEYKHNKQSFTLNIFPLKTIIKKTLYHLVHKYKVYIINKVCNESFNITVLNTLRHF